jgi:hypothetical protein
VYSSKREIERKAFFQKKTQDRDVLPAPCSAILNSTDIFYYYGYGPCYAWKRKPDAMQSAGPSEPQINFHESEMPLEPETPTSVKNSKEKRTKGRPK